MPAANHRPPAEHEADSAVGQETPALRQYLAAKREHPDCVVLFRLGDFFEIFGEDATEMAPILGLTLTGRDFGRGGRIPMCGVPHHSLQTYAAKLLQAGKRVAVCDQVEASRPGGKLVARRVIRVLTAGTLVEDSLLDPKLPRRCAGVFSVPDGVGIAILDFSSGECVLQFRQGAPTASSIGDDLAAWDVAEVVLPEGQVDKLGDISGPVVTPRSTMNFDLSRGHRLLLDSAVDLPVAQPTALIDAAVRALAGAASYGADGRLEIGSELLRPRWQLPGQVMELDQSTRRNLEIVDSLAPGGTSVLRLLDRTRTAPGGRLLRHWLQAPLVDLGLIHIRQEATSWLIERPLLRSELRSELLGCRDLERLEARCVHQVAGPRDLQQLASTLRQLPRLATLLAGSEVILLDSLAIALAQVPLDLASTLDSALADEAPLSAREGGFIKPGYDAELDRIVGGGAQAHQYISGLESQERQRTGIKGLKVGYNRVFGYYLEVRGAAEAAIPADYIRRQTLVGAERYVTAELKDQEAVVLSARDRALERELNLLEQLLALAAGQAGRIGRGAAAMAELDCLLTLADVGAELGWVMPVIDSSRSLELHQGRHPLVEHALGPGRFVPNDAVMDGETERIWLITGPNMAGKSTFLRQVALICLLGQVGAPVPCRAARWGLVDRIFTRVGAQDDLAGGRSTFMVEMTEVAQILDDATGRSLLVLDEVGRGTSTYDGISLAQAILEYLHDTPRVAARVLFSTHYHELTALDRLPALRNYRAEVAEEGEGEMLAFLHTIVPGGADRSYGIHVAQLAGIPPEIVRRAQGILEDLERTKPLTAAAVVGEQLMLPLPIAHPLVAELGTLQVDSMTPLEALQKLAEWQHRSNDQS